MTPSATTSNRSLVRLSSFWVICFVAWNMVVVLNAGQWYIYDLFAGHTTPLLAYLTLSMAVWYTRAALSPIVLYVAARYRLREKAIVKALCLYIVVALGAGLLTSAVQAFTFQLVRSGRPLQDQAVAAIVHRYANEGDAEYRILSGLVRSWNYVLYNLLTYCMVIGLVQAWYYYEDARRRELQTAQLHAELAQTRLSLLRMQLHPHFLFNTLHSIATLFRYDPDAAEDMLLRLSQLLRAFLEQEETPEIPLEKELTFLECHLGIEQVRFGDRLHSSIEVAPNLMDYAVPALILQPLVENAIRHGIGKHEGPDAIQVRIYLETDSLHLDVVNRNGVLDKSSNRFQHGIGLRNTTVRLQTLYRDRATFSLDSLEPTGVAARISIPARRIPLPVIPGKSE
ncbi:sensor histidine kinase [Terriglobus albidus]|uniref:Sensor histidine kinase n=1 Tax=Terriglobus albidus TaxID=1592106 RepID=A0A5B9EEC5_9BACT|nr:histidine kinase [Terriglobus albidus]QEE28406.1 sensor histidine kinase [Terriglobus albidus]